MSVERMALYMFEVQKYLETQEVYKNFEETGHFGDYQHVGYMNVVFRSIQSALLYYAKYNKHMREIQLFERQDALYSDWDPETKLRYVIRPYIGEVQTIEPFNKDDAPKLCVERNENSEIISIKSCQVLV